MSGVTESPARPQPPAIAEYMDAFVAMFREAAAAAKIGEAFPFLAQPSSPYIGRRAGWYPARPPRGRRRAAR